MKEGYKVKQTPFFGNEKCILVAYFNSLDIVQNIPEKHKNVKGYINLVGVWKIKQLKNN